MKHEVEKPSYLPLAAFAFVALVASLSLSLGLGGGLFSWAHFFMGFAFCQFALLKLFNLKGFVDGFSMYDLIAKKGRSYGYFYPFIELLLGLGYLSFFAPILIYLLTVIFMAIGVCGVIAALRKKLDVRCACMGTVLNVPLSTVTLAEDLVMGFMALWMLFF